jgi:hypothetical protein
MNKYQLKAQELVSKFRDINEDYIDSYQSIPCALIAVDELIANEHLEAGDASFWKPVKDELLKM